MKKFSFIFILSATLLLAVSCSRDFVFVQMSDTQVGFWDQSEHYVVSDALLKDAVDAINRIHPTLVVLTGDLINDKNNEEQRAIFNKRMAEIDKGIPVWYTPGNHDIPEFNKENLEEYLNLVGYDRFSFMKKGCAFIGFDSCRIRSNDRDAEEEQFEWLKGELAKVKGSKHIFLFCHCPLVRRNMEEKMNHDSFPVELRQKYLSLFLESGVDALFSGHTHSGRNINLGSMQSVNAGPVARAFFGLSGINVVKVTEDGFESQFRTGKDILEHWPE